MPNYKECNVDNNCQTHDISKKIRLESGLMAKKTSRLYDNIKNDAKMTTLHVRNIRYK